MVGPLAFFGCLFAGPVVIVLVLDRIGRQVIADCPGKFGPKVPTVGKWNRWKKLKPLGRLTDSVENRGNSIYPG